MITVQYLIADHITKEYRAMQQRKPLMTAQLRSDTFGREALPAALILMDHRRIRGISTLLRQLIDEEYARVKESVHPDIVARNVTLAAERISRA